MADDLKAKNCGDCGVAPGQPHIDGCDVARCIECGWQRIGCDHEDSDDGWGAIWTGEWPGDVECREFGFWCLDKCAEGKGWVPCPPGTPGAREDLNRLSHAAAFGEVIWSVNRQRFVRRPAAREREVRRG